MKIIFLGTNGWYTNQTGDTACVLIEAKDQYIVLDAGNGFSKLDNYITKEKPVALFISHFHIDHVSGLHTLGKFHFPGGLDVYVGQGRQDDFKTLVHPPFTIGYQNNSENVSNLPYEIRLHELSENQTDLGSFSASAIEQHHAYRDHGYRFVLERKTIAYSGDCSISENSKALSDLADVLIHECSMENDASNDTWGHVGPVQAATLAKNSRVGDLLLTHFDPLHYQSLQDRKRAEEIAKRIFPKTRVAYDDLVIEV